MRLGPTIKNYRPFEDSFPCRIELSDGFIGLIGVNNAGKSSLLKFFYELRSAFQMLGDEGTLASVLQSGTYAFNFAGSVTDVAEVFCNANDRDLRVEIDLHDSLGINKQEAPFSRRLQMLLRIPRGTNEIRDIELRLDGSPLSFSAGHSPSVNLTEVSQAISLLGSTLYIGPFRNAISVGTNASYFDIQVGQSFVSNWRILKTGPSRRQNEAIYRLTENIR